MALLDKSDEEIIKIAEPIWANLVKSSNIKDYGGFTRDLSSQMMYGANEVELGKQWASNKLISSLADTKNFQAYLDKQNALPLDWYTDTQIYTEMPMLLDPAGILYDMAQDKIMDEMIMIQYEKLIS